MPRVFPKRKPVPVATEADKQAARDSGLDVVWHARDGRLVPFVPLTAWQARYDLGYNVGHEAGLRAGFEEGRRLASDVPLN